MENEKSTLLPSSIIDWELKHGIIREMRNGVQYIRCVNFDTFTRMIDDENKARQREALNRRIGEAQAKAYLGEGA